MSEPFQPNEGDTVEFYNEEAELWETGTVFSSSANRRTYFVQPDDENQPMHILVYTNIRPMSQDEDADEFPSFWGAAKSAVRQRNEWQAVAIEDATRAEKAEGLLSEARVGWKTSDEAANAAEARLQDEKARADLWKARAHRNSLERREEADRAGRVADMLDQTITERDAMTRRANAAEARIEELEDQNRQLKSELAELKAALRTLAGSEKPAEFPAWVKDNDFEVWNHTGNGRYSLEGSDRFYQDVPLGEVESTYGIRERSDS